MFKAQAVILAGGQGMRLRPYTTILPKPLLPVGEFPIIEIIIRQLKAQGINRIVISTGYLGSLIEAYCQDGRRWGVTIHYVHEQKPLGTAGALRLVKNTEDNFLVLNGDVFTNMNFAKMLSVHRKLKVKATMAVKERQIKSDFGVIDINQNHELVNYHEKPVQRLHLSIGVNALHREALSLIPKGKLLGMPDLMLKVKSLLGHVHCHVIDDVWLDLGRFEDLEQAKELMEKQSSKFIKP